MDRTFPIQRARRTTVSMPAKDAKDRVSSYYVEDGAMRRMVADGVLELRGITLLGRTQPGDIARSFFGSVVR